MTKHRWIIILMVFQISQLNVWCYPDGAPEAACADLMPQHGVQSQSYSTNVYELKVSSTEIALGDKLTVTLTKSTPNDQFMGFLIKIVSVGASNGSSVGQISSIDSATTKFLTCSGISQSVLTHTHNTPKPEISFEWTAPTTTASVKFMATVVKDYATFWNKIESPEIKVQGRSVEPTLTATTSVKFNSPEAKAPTTQFKPQGTRSPTFNFDYTICGESKNCFGFPVNCIEDQTCTSVVAYNAENNRLHFELVSDTTGYVAFGLSEDQLMGDDSVIECMVPGRANASVNRGTNNYIANGDESYFTLESASYVDGILKCQISRPIETTVKAIGNGGSISTNLAAMEYYLMIAVGPLKADGSNIAFHGPNGMLASSISVDLMKSEFLIVGGNNKPAIEIVVHGSLMVVAWIGTVSIAIFMARYYKDMWPETMWCNVKVWFTFHRSLNMMTLLLTIAAFVLIFIYKKGFSPMWRHNPHPILGCVTMGLAVLQAFGALFRCAPGTPKRPIFNWFHYLLGNLTCIIAVVTIFFAVNLSAAHLPTYFWWILIAYVAFYVIMFLVMECLGYMNHRKAEMDVIPMRNYNGHDGSLSSSMHHLEKNGSTKFKYVMLLLFFFGVIGFTAALVAVICT